MIGPLWLFTLSRMRAQKRRRLSRGLQNLSVGSHHPSVTLDGLLARQRNSSSPSCFGSGRDRTVVVILAGSQDCKGDARQLIGERDRGQLEGVLRGSGLARQKILRPASQRI